MPVICPRMNSLRISRGKTAGRVGILLCLSTDYSKYTMSFFLYRNKKFTIDYDRYLTKGDMSIMLKLSKFSSVSTGISQTTI